MAKVSKTYELVETEDAENERHIIRVIDMALVPGGHVVHQMQARTRELCLLALAKWGFQVIEDPAALVEAPQPN